MYPPQVLAALLVNTCIPSSSWRFIFLLGCIPALLMGLGLVFSPESPRWPRIYGPFDLNQCLPRVEVMSLES